MMHTLTVKLKQHTPLIHFQHNQEGATLRASEVKPKLDKYIIEKEFDNNFDKCKKYLIGYSLSKDGKLKNLFETKAYRALDYSLYITTSSKETSFHKMQEQLRGKNELNQPLFDTVEYPNRSNSIIMGNMGGRTKDSVLNFTFSESTTLLFRSMDANTLILIEKCIGEFISETNFGNRTSKGFGSYTVSSINDEKYEYQNAAEWILHFALLADDKTSDIENPQDAMMKDVFIVINSVWRYLKGNKKNSKLSGKDPKRVMLGFFENLPGDSERVPSPIFFKPVIERKKNEWDVCICMLTNKDVIDACRVDINQMYTFIDKLVASYDKSFDFNKLGLINTIRFIEWRPVE